MLYFSWVKETAEVVRYEALLPLHPFVDIFHYYRLKERFRHSLSGHCACSYAIVSALGSLALKKTCNKNERLPGRSGQVGFEKNAY